MTRPLPFWIVDDEASGKRLDAWLAGRPEIGSRGRAQDALACGKILLNDAEVTFADAGRRLAAGDRVGYWPDRPGSSKPRRREIVSARASLDVVHQDEAVLVVNKPAGWIVEPLPGEAQGEVTLLDLVADHLRAGIRIRPYVVHRIDRDTSGLVLFALTAVARDHLKAQFERQTPERVYLAIVNGHPEPESGTWRDKLVWDKERLIQKRAHLEEARGKDAEARYRVIERFEWQSLIEVALRTGKRNQIRVQAGARGYPLVGERQYRFGRARDDSREPAFSRQALHATRLGFVHPLTGRRVTFTAALPEDMAGLLELLRPRAADRPRRAAGGGVTRDPAAGRKSRAGSADIHCPAESEVPVRARRILIVTPEAVPFAKTGGLGDVAGALPLALARLGLDVTVVLPRYRGAPAGTELERAAVPMAGRTFDVRYVEHALADRARAVLVECPELYDRPDLYGTGNADYPDNPLRFAVLSRAALEFAARADRAPDVVHAHDWQAGLTPVYLETLFANRPTLNAAGRVFTIHNLAYQGLFPPVWMPALDLRWDLFGVEGLEYWGKLSFLKAGINYSEFVTTVSPRYAREIQAPELGFGFDGILRRRGKQVCGILNGIDTSVWNPETDPYLPSPYGAKNLSAKRASKRALLEAMSLPVTPATLDRPVVGIVSRMVDQKGFDLLGGLAAEVPAMDASFVLLGTGETRYQKQWQALRDQAPDRVAVWFGFNDRLAHLVEAGSDIFLMPSQFEPCGLNQMYSLRYGTVPVVRGVGGLDDTIENWNPRTKTGTGFKFKDYTVEALRGALGAALELYRTPRLWRAVQQAGMARDFSWDASAAEYVKVYEKAIRARNRRQPA